MRCSAAQARSSTSPLHIQRLRRSVNGAPEGWRRLTQRRMNGAYFCGSLQKILRKLRRADDQFHPCRREIAPDGALRRQKRLFLHQHIRREKDRISHRPPCWPSRAPGSNAPSAPAPRLRAGLPTAVPLYVTYRRASPNPARKLIFWTFPFEISNPNADAPLRARQCNTRLLFSAAL